jgi:5-methylcytosine-specific restriction enzyme A
MPQRIASYRPPRVACGPRGGDEARPNAYRRGYVDRRHRAWRQAVLTRDAWTCRHCGRVCGATREAHADHVTPIAAGGSRYDLANGQCLCQSCHSRKTAREGRSNH